MIDIKKQYKHLLLLVMVILFLTGCFSESINKRISRSLGIEIPKDIKIEYEDTHGGFHGDGETVAVVEFNNSIGEDIQSNNKELFHKLFGRKDSIENQLGMQLDWQELPGKKASRIIATRQGNFLDEQESQELIQWLVETADRFSKVFPKYL